MPRIYFKDRLKNIRKISKLDPVLILLQKIVNLKLIAERLSRAGFAGENG